MPGDKPRETIAELLERGRNALQGGWLEEAEDCFVCAITSQPRSSGITWLNAHYHLGETYARQERWEEAVNAWERALPLASAAPAKIISVYRREGKAALKAGDRDRARMLFDRVLSISYLQQHLLQMMRAAGNWNGYEPAALAWLAKLRAENKTIYLWSYERDGAVPCEDALSNRDYKTMHTLAFGEGKT
jgi:tetratricopeptide (TPR) repeat protein